MRHVKPHELTGLSREVHYALDAVGRDLREGRVVHHREETRTGSFLRSWGLLAPSFDMSVWRDCTYAMKPSGCIGLHLERRLGREVTPGELTEIRALVLPDVDRSLWAGILPWQAGWAVDNFLHRTPRDPRWPAVLGVRRVPTLPRVAVVDWVALDFSVSVDGTTTIAFAGAVSAGAP